MNNTSEPRLVTTTLPFDGGRGVTVFIPDGHPEAIVYAGDGALTAEWGESLTGLPPVMVVGVHAIESDDEMDRIKEYSPSFDPARFEAHEQFIIHDVRTWIEEQFDVRLPAERTAICGASAGGELALALGLRHPGVFGNVFSMSPGGGFQPPASLPASLPLVYLTAGIGEPWFLENAVRWQQALVGAGADVVMTQREGEHGGAFWAEEFRPMVHWMLEY